ELGAQKVVSRAARDVHAKFLLRNGADEVVYPEKQLASWTAIRYTADHILDYIQLTDDYAIFEVSIPKTWIGKTVGQIDIRKRYNINIMALKKGSRLYPNISPETMLNETDTMLVMGEYATIQKCFHI
ncbi:MAG: TrkA C-terminal domain-containing protein, partial [Oscillospiraceae bacterium]